jgi:hypothetical protein
VAHHAEIVADEQHGEAELAAQLENRLMICAWIETSSEATGSSQTSTSGCIASARAIAMRWRWPPENWCGKRLD